MYLLDSCVPLIVCSLLSFYQFFLFCLNTERIILNIIYIDDIILIAIKISLVLAESQYPRSVHLYPCFTGSY